MKTLRKIWIPLLLLACLTISLFLLGACAERTDTTIDTVQPTESTNDQTVEPTTETETPDNNNNNQTNDEATEAVTEYVVTVKTDENVTVYVYDTQDYTTTPTQTTSAYARDSETGEIVTDGTGQVNLRLDVADGYVVQSVTVAEEGCYNSVKTPVDTGAENVYRITKITSDLTVTVTVMTVEEAENTNNGYLVTFVTDEHVTVYAYRYQDYTEEPVASDTTYSRNGDYGYTTRTDGQVNFKVVCDEGYVLDDISITGSYKNLKGPADTEQEDTYRVTKIASELTISVTTKAENDENEEEIPEEEQVYTVSFVGEHVRVYVNGEQAESAVAIDKNTGLPTISGEGQVTFVIECDEGYEYEVAVTSGTYKNLKDPDETGTDNTYRITKISSDLVVTITTNEVQE